MTEASTPGIEALLDQARASLAAGALEPALAALLAAWRRIPAAPLADLVDRVSELAAAARPELTGATQAAFAEQWLARAREADAVEVGVLLPTLMQVDSYQARKRLKLLARHAPDPRLALAFAEIVATPPFTAGSTAKFWQTLHELLVACPDPRALARLEQVEAPDADAPSNVLRLDGWRRRSVAKLRAALGPASTELDEGQRARLATVGEALERVLAQTPQTGPELLAAVYAAPSDPEPRQIYADYLLERGDPRGEFIALQLADLRGGLDKAGRARVRALLGEHRHAWLGPLAPVLVQSGTEFHGGFLARARLKRSPRGLDELREDPSWATVEALELAPPELAASPALRGLRALRWSEWQLISAHQAALRFPGVRELVVEGRERDRYYDRAPLTLALPPVFEDPSWLPDLIALELITELEPGRVAWAWTGRLVEQLERLTIRSSWPAGLGLSGCLRSLRASVAADSPSRLAELRLVDRQLDCRFVRGPAGWTRAELRAGPELEAEDVALELRWLAELDDLALDYDARLTAALGSAP